MPGWCKRCRGAETVRAVAGDLRYALPRMCVLPCTLRLVVQLRGERLPMVVDGAALAGGGGDEAAGDGADAYTGRLGHHADLSLGSKGCTPATLIRTFLARAGA